MPEEPTESEETPEPASGPDGAASRSPGRTDASDEVRARLGFAALELAGERGYPSLTVRLIHERTGTSRGVFYALFADKEECFAAGFDAAANELEAELLGPCEEAGGWIEGMEEALRALARVLEARPARARGLLGEGQNVAGAARARSKEGFERLSRAIDRARRENDPSRHSPPPVTAAFILNGIESAALRNLRTRDGRDFVETVPELLHFAVAPYFGSEAAAAAYRRALRRRR